VAPPKRLPTVQSRRSTLGVLERAAFLRARVFAAGSATPSNCGSGLPDYVRFDGQPLEPGSKLSEKVANPDPQGVGDDLKRIERHALASILQPVEMNTIKAGEFGKLILRDPFLQAQSPDSFPNCPVDVLQQLRLRVYAALKHPA